ncbi:IreB family regulatory phosphoprotein [Acetobacterium bakii]|uniref:IreB family regulatory phosphoprotein n=1 Tax=Acetobacterium bakii TaxID=52689 RepID=UPI00191BD439|nr:IreB family regulatory phosphoprotein [Acetobacterium bakii]
MIDQGTIMFEVDNEKAQKIDSVMRNVHKALVEKGYNPINQIVGYVMSGDPTYITSHREARNAIQKIERDELLEELVRRYLNSI